MNSPSSVENAHLELHYICLLYQEFHKTGCRPHGSWIFMGIYFSIWCLHLESNLAHRKISALSPCHGNLSPLVAKFSLEIQ